MKGLSVLTAVVLLLMVHAGRVSAEGVFSLASCEPDCTGIVNGDGVPDPSDCTAFYFCNDGDAYGPVPCGDGSVFDEELGQCTRGDPDACVPICGSRGSCPLTCNANLATIGDAFDCSTYYYCTTSGVSAPQSCPVDRPHFDGNTHACVNKSVCCSGYCEAYCDGTGFSMVPDPRNCTRFYICDSDEGPPDEDHHFACDGYFDVQLGKCVADMPPDPCPTLCDAARGMEETWSNFLYKRQEWD